MDISDYQKQCDEFIKNYNSKICSYSFNEPTYTNSLEEYNRLKKNCPRTI